MTAGVRCRHPQREREFYARGLWKARCLACGTWIAGTLGNADMSRKDEQRLATVASGHTEWCAIHKIYPHACDCGLTL